jgi:hypothetical protein
MEAERATGPASDCVRSPGAKPPDRGGIFMAKFLIQAAYTADGARGLLKEGGTKRRQ